MQRFVCVFMSKHPMKDSCIPVLRITGVQRCPNLVMCWRLEGDQLLQFHSS